MKRQILSLIAVFASGIVLAEPIGRDAARYTAQAYLSQRGRSLQATATPYRAPRKVKSSDAAYYVFNAGDDKGFVIVSGDTRMPEILGYADAGSFSEDAMPDNMRSFLQGFADEIQSMDESGTTESAYAKARRKVKATRHSIPALVKSRWNQGTPYNLSCPNYYKKDGTTGRPAAGCAAIALAQVIYHYKHPDSLAGAIPAHYCSYPLNDGTTRRVDLPAIPSGTKIDWANMLDSYSGSETDEQKKAVADFVFYCGQALKMGWNASSGAVTSYSLGAVKNYFGFAKSAIWANRSSYDLEQWYDMLYSELAEGYPVLYKGQSSGGGHAFVIDGFDGEGLFHVNWGWGGSSDGWYLLSSMAPGKDAGDGASSTADGYTMLQAAMLRVRIPNGETEEPVVKLSVSNVQCSASSVTATFKNSTGSTGNFVAGIVYYDDETESFVPVGTTQTLTSMADESSQTLTFNLRRSLKPGTYHLSPASRELRSPTWQPGFNIDYEYILCTVDEYNQISLDYSSARIYKLAVDTIAFPGTRVVNTSQPVRVVFRNLADEFFKQMTLYVGKDGTKAATESMAAVTVPKGGTGESTFYFKPTETGTYDVWICSNDGATVYGHSTVDIVTTGVGASLKVTNITIANSSGGKVYGNRLQGTITVQNTGDTRFDGKVQLRLWRQPGGTGTAYSASARNLDFTIEPGRSGVASFSFENISVAPVWYIVANYVSQDGSLENGAMWNTSHRYQLNPGILYWKETGALACAAPKALYNMPSTAAGIYLKDVEVTRLSANRNPNSVYAFAAGTALPQMVTTFDNLNVVVGNVADSVSFHSGYSYFNPVDYTARKASFTYTVPQRTQAAWEAILLPFGAQTVRIDSVEYELNADDAPFCVYEFVTTDRYGLPIFRPATKVLGNVPYLIAASPDLGGRSIIFEATDVPLYKSGTINMVVTSETFKLYATSLQTTVKESYHLSSDGTAYVYDAAVRSVAPLTTYFTSVMADDARPDRILLPAIPASVATSVGRVPAAAAASQAVYNIMGQRVSTTSAASPASGLRPGLYVVGGRKVMIK